MTGSRSLKLRELVHILTELLIAFPNVQVHCPFVLPCETFFCLEISLILCSTLKNVLFNLAIFVLSLLYLCSFLFLLSVVCFRTV